LTVPRGRPVSDAISASERSAKKRRATVSRYGSSSAATAALIDAVRSDRSAAIAGSEEAGAVGMPTPSASGSIHVTDFRRAARRMARRTAIRASQAPNGPSPRHVASDR